MVFNVAQVKQSYIDTLNGSTIAKTVAQNPMWTAFIIALAALLIMLFSTRNIGAELSTGPPSDEVVAARYLSPKTTALMSGSAFVFIFSAGLMLFHNSVLLEEARASGETTGAKDIIYGSRDVTAQDPDFVPVRINFDLLK
jgi:hypothetical protein